MRRALRLLGVVVLLAVVGIVLLLPPASLETAAPPAATVRGVYHIHTNRSDGSGTPNDVADAAARAGLHFVIVTDHGDGTRQPDPPAYRSGVLMLDAVELNTSGGHYAALGMPVAPYPLAGTPGAVIEDVTRLGGFGIAAHPGSARPSLQWTAWDAAVDGLEWLNGDSEWRDEPRLPIARVLATYLFRAPESMATLLDRPSAVLEQWDRLTRSRRVVAIAASDAHARLGFSEGSDPDLSAVHVPAPGYTAMFRTLSNHVVLDAPFTGRAAEDAERLLAALRNGRLYSVIDGLASPGALSLTATSGGRVAQMGDDLAIDGDVQLRAAVSAPPGATIVLLKNGDRIHEVTDGILDMNGGTDPAVYRVEVYVRDGPGGPAVPWMVSNPISAGLTRPAPGPIVETAPRSRIPARVSEATVAAGRADRSELTASIDPRARRIAGQPPMAWSFALSPGAPSGQFAAIQIPITGGLAAFDRVRFSVSSPTPLRAWVQLRAPVGNTERWGTTFYTDAAGRLVDLPLREFMPIGVTSSEQPPLDRVDTLLFVVDTLNFRPGATGSMLLSAIVFVR